LAVLERISPGLIMVSIGVVTSLSGLFLFLWYRTVVSLPLRKQPRFINPALFKWGMPSLSLVVFVIGLYFLASASFLLAGSILALAAFLLFLIIKLDPYSAEMRLIHSHYLGLRQDNPALEEIEILFCTAKWRYPQWSHDRIVELVAGKDIEHLILLMLINENQINPISDWALYQSLKQKAARTVRS
jgi:hypothetical protein